MTLAFSKLNKYLLIVVLVMPLVSCGYKDIDKRAFVVAIGVDTAESDDKKYKVMLKVAIPTPDMKAGEQKFIISERESNSITDAIRLMKSKVDKELDFSHAKAIVLGEDVVKEGYEEVLDWFIRRRDVQKIAWVAIGKPNAKEILSMKRKIERMPANALFLSFGQSGTESVYIISEYLFDFRKRITEKGLDPILPIIESKGEYFEINKAALLDEQKLRKSLTEEETKILNIMLKRAQKVDVRVMNHDQDRDAFFISVDDTKVNYKIRTKEKPKIEVRVQMEGIIEEALVDFPHKQLGKYKADAEKQFKKKILKLLTMLQEEQLDPIGFGLQYRASSFEKNDWEQWKEIYPTVEFDVDVEITIQGTGLLQ